jgi:hypothetical protein
MNCIGMISEIKNCSLKGWFIRKSEIIPKYLIWVMPAQEREKLRGSGF